MTTGSFKPLPVLISFMDLFQPHPILHVQNKAKKIPPKGKMLLEIIKSSISIILFSPMIGICAPDHMLKPRQHGTLKSTMTKKLTLILFARVHPVSSIQKATIFSKTAITVDMAAKLRKTKNAAPNIDPHGIEANTFGKVSNTKLGPEPGFTP